MDDQVVTGIPTANGGFSTSSRFGFAHGPASATSSTALISGVLQLVTPIVLQTMVVAVDRTLETSRIGGFPSDLKVRGGFELVALPLARRVVDGESNRVERSDAERGEGCDSFRLGLRQGAATAGSYTRSSRLLGRQQRELGKFVHGAVVIPVHELAGHPLEGKLVGASDRDHGSLRGHHPLSAGDAATLILDGVREERWRILVGEDAKILDQRVREAPED